MKQPYSQIVSFQNLVILPVVWSIAQRNLVSVCQGFSICHCMVINLGYVPIIVQTGKRGQLGILTKHWDGQGSVWSNLLD